MFGAFVRCGACLRGRAFPPGPARPASFYRGEGPTAAETRSLRPEATFCGAVPLDLVAVGALAATAGVAVLMAVLPRLLVALRRGQAEGLGQQAAMLLLLAAGGLAVLGAWARSPPAFVANVAAMGTCLGFLVQAERCQAIQAERRAIAARMRGVRPTRRAAKARR